MAIFLILQFQISVTPGSAKNIVLKTSKRNCQKEYRNSARKNVKNYDAKKNVILMLKRCKKSNCQESIENDTLFCNFTKQGVVVSTFLTP